MGTGGIAPGRVPKRSLRAVSGFVVGVLSLAAFVAESLTPVGPAGFVASQNSLALLAFRSYAWGLFAVSAIPFFVVVGAALRPRGADGAMAATLLSVVGAVLYSLRGILQDAALAAASTIAAPSSSQADYLGFVLFATANPLLPLGGAILGLGYLFFGVLTWKSGILPNWLAIVAVVGGVAGWAIFPVINSQEPFIGYVFTEIGLPFTTAIWGFACGAIFARQSQPTDGGS